MVRTTCAALPLTVEVRDLLQGALLQSVNNGFLIPSGREYRDFLSRLCLGAPLGRVAAVEAAEGFQAAREEL